MKQINPSRFQVLKLATAKGKTIQKTYQHETHHFIILAPPK